MMNSGNTQLTTHKPILVDEVPLAIAINDISYAVMLVSPMELEDFVVGFLHSESVIANDRDIHEIVIEPHANSMIANVTIANRCLAKLNETKRILKGTSGCGLCGTKALEQAFPDLAPLSPSKPFSLKKAKSLKNNLRQWQRHGRESGALHAAFWLDSQGNIVQCREDIGRHNALDKLIGYLLRCRPPTKGAAILVTSRCSVELVQKTILAGVENLISLASPSKLAVEMAQSHGLHLIHIPKRDQPYYLTGETVHAQ